MESAASGILAAHNMYSALTGQEPLVLPKDTMMGALAAYISDETVADFQPMGANMGILPPSDVKIKDKAQRYEAIAQRGLESLHLYLNNRSRERKGE